MNPENEIQEPEIMEPDEPVEVIDADDVSSVDDFLRELEEKEKDLHITSDLKIEIEDSEFDGLPIPEFVQQELKPVAKTEEPSAAAPAAAEQNSRMKTRVFELEKEVESLRGKITELRMERNDIQQKSDRRSKDFESYKYRMDRERRGSFINQIGNLASQMLPVLDNLDRALNSIKDVPDKKRDEFKQFFDGIALVHQQINEVFSSMGVQPITTVGETFDPNFHEAASTDEESDLPPNTISAEMLRGYRIGNLVIRHSMVRVTPTPPPSKKSDQTDVKSESEESDTSTSISEPADLPVEEAPTDAEQA